MKKFSLSERNFFCSRAAIKSSFLQILIVMRFDYDILLVSGLL